MHRAPTVLVVDDDRAIQRMLADALSSQGFSVLVEKDGEWALRTFERKSVDAVVLDLVLPGMDGFEVARRLRLYPKGERIPLIICSGVYQAAAEAMELVRHYGALEFLEKPFRLRRLFDALKRGLGDDYPSREQAWADRTQVDGVAPERFADADARQEVDEVEETVREAPRRASAVRGDFRQVPFPELLAELRRWKANGALLLRRDKVKKILYLREGRPFSIKSNLLNECLGKLLVLEKMISEEECDESLRRMKDQGHQQGTALVEMGAISPHNLGYALRQQLLTKLFDIFHWSSGEYHLNPDASLPAETTSIDMTTAALIYEGVKRSFDERRLERVLGNVDHKYVHPASDPLYRFQEVGLDEEESLLLAAIDGRKTVATLRALALLPPLGTMRFVYAMRCAQMVELCDEASSALKEAPPLLVPPPLPPPPLPPPAQANPAPRHSSSLLPELSGVFASPLPRDERQLRERLATTVAAMRYKDHFEILGVSRDASEEQIHHAYLGLARQFHPDKHFATASAEIRKLAEEIFDRISAAQSALIDPEERESYVEELGRGVRSDVSDGAWKVIAAEGKFQQGADLLKQKRFKEAHATFEEAVKLCDDEGEFHAYLGWSLFQAEPGSEPATQGALEHLERAIHLNPAVDRSYLFLGYVYKATGRPDKAGRQFEKALQCNPDCLEALEELRLLGKIKQA